MKKTLPDTTTTAPEGFIVPDSVKDIVAKIEKEAVEVYADHLASQTQYVREKLIEELAKAEGARHVCAEAYQVVGSLLVDLGKFDSPEGIKILDNLSEARLVHEDVLPWPSFEKPYA